MGRLFEPFSIGDLRLDNRIVIAPMCQYSAIDGVAGDWHMIHLYDPRWPWHAAAALGAQVHAPKQYWRSQPREYKDLFKDATSVSVDAALDLKARTLRQFQDRGRVWWGFDTGPNPVSGDGCTVAQAGTVEGIDSADTKLPYGR